MSGVRDERTTVLPEQGRDAPEKPHRRRLIIVAASALVIVAAVVCLLLSVHAYRTALRGRGELTAFETALRDQDLPAARRHLDAARQELDSARAAALPIRLLGSVPVVGRAGRDAGLLLDSASNVAAAGADVLALQQATASSPLLSGGRLRTDRIAAMHPTSTALLQHVRQARTDLDGISGGWPVSARLTGLRDQVRGQVDELAGNAQLIELALRAIPAGLGGSHQYLVTTLNYAELHGGGGAPLGLATLQVSNGAVAVTSRGQTSDLVDARAGPSFRPLPTDPWLRGARHKAFINANQSPDFATDGEEMLRLYESQFHTRPAGVIAVDPTALAAVLKLTGPISVPGLGTVGADQLVQRLLVDSYLEAGQDEAAHRRRHQTNDALMDAMFVRLLRASPSAGELKGLLATARAGHLRVYSRDRQLQALIRRVGLSGELAPFSDDQLGVYTFNVNASKVDVWQRRSVDQQVSLQPDGSAAVLRTITIVNDVRRPCARPDDRKGYDTCVSAPLLMTSLPLAARGVSLAVHDPGRASADRPAHHLDEAGRQVWSARLDLEPGETATLVLRYRLPASRIGGYQLRYDGQPIATDPALTVRVTPAPGRSLTGDGWHQQRAAQVTSTPLVGSGDLALRVD